MYILRLLSWVTWDHCDGFSFTLLDFPFIWRVVSVLSDEFRTGLCLNVLNCIPAWIYVLVWAIAALKIHTFCVIRLSNQQWFVCVPNVFKVCDPLLGRNCASCEVWKCLRCFATKQLTVINHYLSYSTFHPQVVLVTGGHTSFHVRAQHPYWGCVWCWCDMNTRVVLDLIFIAFKTLFMYQYGT